jgi:DNA polymerase
MAFESDSLVVLDTKITACELCELAHTRKHAVPGSGNVDSNIMFIGEGPGKHEDENGLPFVGAAGKLLDELLQGIDLRREDVYITNIVKCRPPQNRDPNPEEIAFCNAYLERQIDLIDPSVIVTLGRFSMARWFPGTRISDIHGVPKRFGSRVVVPMFHPAAALYNPNKRPVLHEDFSRLPGFITEVNSEDNNRAQAVFDQLDLL